MFDGVDGMTEKEVFYPAEEFYKKQNNCEFYLVKTDYKLLMIDDIVRILNNQRETIRYHRKTEKQLEKEHTRLTNQLRLSYNKINKLSDENEQLKQYKQAVADVLINWSQKDLTAKQLGVVIAIMKELNVLR